MPKRPTAYHRPQSLNEALLLLAKPNTVPLAGGTSLLADDIGMALVDIQDLGLDGIQLNNSQLSIGATAKLVNVAEFLEENGSDIEQEDIGDGNWLLQRVIAFSGPNTYRNAATIGGVVADRLADSELLAALLTMDAELVLKGLEPGTLSLANYLGNSDRPKGLITEINIPWVEGLGCSERVARTPADYPIVSVTAWHVSNEGIKLAATGIDERPVRLNEAERILNVKFTEASIAVATKAVKESVRHPGDFRGDSAYRAEMAEILTNRVLNKLYN